MRCWPWKLTLALLRPPQFALASVWSLFIRVVRRAGSARQHRAMVDVARHLDIRWHWRELFVEATSCRIASARRCRYFEYRTSAYGRHSRNPESCRHGDAHYGTIIPHAAQGPICIWRACISTLLRQTPGCRKPSKTSRALERNLLTAFPRIVDGYFDLPQGPGIGADLNLEEIQRHPYSEHEMSLFEDNGSFRRTKRAADLSPRHRLPAAQAVRPESTMLNARRSLPATAAALSIQGDSSFVKKSVLLLATLVCLLSRLAAQSNSSPRSKFAGPANIFHRRQRRCPYRRIHALLPNPAGRVAATFERMREDGFNIVDIYIPGLSTNRKRQIDFDNLQRFLIWPTNTAFM